MKKSILLIMIIIFLSAQGVLAHHLWIEKKGDRFEVKWGHPPKITPYETEKLKVIEAFNNKGEKVVLERKNDKDIVYLLSKLDISMITVSFENGYIVSTPDGKKRITKSEAVKSGLQVIDSFYSLQFAKGLFAYSENITKPSGLKFEIVPLENPYKLKPNEILPVRVYFEGKPIEGAKVETGEHAEAGKTDKDGIFNLKISEKGMHIIVAKYRIPTKDNPDADYLAYTTVLTFEVK